MRPALPRQSLQPALVAAGLAWASAARAAPAPLSPHDLALLNRLTWGESASSAAELQAMGARAWPDPQLRPQAGARLPAAAQAEIDALPVSQTPMADLVVQMAA